jgi:hypothetical protein
LQAVPQVRYDMNPVEGACAELLKELSGKNVPITVNDPNRRGIVFAYSGDDWELFSQAIREAVDRVQEKRLENKSGSSFGHIGNET